MKSLPMKAWLSIVALLASCIITSAWAESAIKSTPLLKSTTTTIGDKIEYLQTNKPEVTSLIIQLEPGAETGWHKHPVPTYAYVQTGNLTVDMQDRSRHEFSAGTAFVEVMNTWHNGKNFGKTPVTILVFYSGEEGRSNVIWPDKEAIINPSSK